MSAQHRAGLGHYGIKGLPLDGENPFQEVVESIYNSPVTSLIKLVTKRDCRYKLGCVLPPGWEYFTNANDGYVLARVVLLTARLSELSSPERLVGINSKTKIFEFPNDGFGAFCGDNDIVPVDTHLTSKTMDGLPGHLASERIFDPAENDGREDHRLNRKAER
jgi:hypothetical protein